MDGERLGLGLFKKQGYAIKKDQRIAQYAGRVLSKRDYDSGKGNAGYMIQIAKDAFMDAYVPSGRTSYATYINSPTNAYFMDPAKSERRVAANCEMRLSHRNGRTVMSIYAKVDLPPEEKVELLVNYSSSYKYK